MAGEKEARGFEERVIEHMAMTTARLEEGNHRLDRIEKGLDNIVETRKSLMTRSECDALHGRDNVQAQMIEGLAAIARSQESIAQMVKACKNGIAEERKHAIWPKTVQGWVGLVGGLAAVIAFVGGIAFAVVKVMTHVGIQP